MSETTSEPTKFCKHCKWLRRELLMPTSLARCGHKDAVKFDSGYPVDGEHPKHDHCSAMRGQYDDRCGPSAKLWEPRK